MRSLTFRMLLFNLLLVFFPIISFLTLDTYEKQLLDSQERAMVQQGRLLASALAGLEPVTGQVLVTAPGPAAGPDSAEGQAADRQVPAERGFIFSDEPVSAAPAGDLAERARNVLAALASRTEARIRVVDHQGRLQADSVPSPGTEEPAAPEYASLRKGDSSVPEDRKSLGRDTWLYRITVYPLNVLRNLLLPPDRPLSSAEYYSGRSVLEGPEIAAALAGRYGAATRISEGQRSVTLYSAIPVPGRDGGVIGAVLVSQSTFKILSDLYVLRLDVIRIFFLALTAAVVLSFLLSWTITIPVHRLRLQAESLLDHRGKLKGTIGPGRGKDEIAVLTRSLHRLSVKLEERQNYLDNFLSDTVHEINNPVTGAATSLELARDALISSRTAPAAAEKVEEVLQFLAAAEEEIHRVRHLTADLREMNFLENRIAEEDVVDLELTRYLSGLIEAHAPGMAERSGVHLRGELPGQELRLTINPERLTQALMNLLLNAESFSPPGGAVTLSLRLTPSSLEIAVRDQGPGIPSGSEDRIFQRFFSDRPGKASAAPAPGETAGALTGSAPSALPAPPVPGSTGGRQNHSGLGLAIVKAIVEGFGGTVTLDRSYTAGACFRLAWPRTPG